MVAVRIYVEGGGNSRANQAPLREGFRKFFEKLLSDAPKPQVRCCGGRDKAFDDFQKALKSNMGDLCILLVDSEAPIAEGTSVWQHVRMRVGDGWKTPEGAGEEHLYLMVQCTEAWLIADHDALKSYYGSGFKEAALPGASNVEQVSKADLYKKLDSATRATTKGKYEHSHAFDIIALVAPSKVRAKSAHAERLFSFLEANCRS